ncbi:MAG TPA: polysaccharide deacetylase family protein, partial [Nitrospirota bacterium]|nr:polysaccharide deacetylase family protein [Nitrospirota bacterium]
LTFDDGPTGPSTGKILDVLSEHGVKATFFVIGANLARYPDLARRIHDDGHEMGNHTHSHPWIFNMLFSTIRADIVRCQDEIEKVAGYRPRFFRQPVGLNNPSVMKVIDSLGMVMIGWQARAYDAVPAKKDRIVRRILAKVRPGGIILLHDGSDGKTRPDRTATVEALKEIIPALKARGYEFRTVSGLLGIENIQPSPPAPLP